MHNTGISTFSVGVILTAALAHAVGTVDGFMPNPYNQYNRPNSFLPQSTDLHIRSTADLLLSVNVKQIKFMKHKQ